MMVSTGVGSAPHYARTQVGWWLLAILVVALLLVVAPLVLIGRDNPRAPAQSLRAILVVVPAIVLGSAAMFSTLRVEVDHEILRWRFGPGLVRFSLPLTEIASVVPARTSLLAGLGIHWIGSGWVYNVSGRDAVEITRRDGKKVWLGTPEPAALVAAIGRARSGRT